MDSPKKTDEHKKMAFKGAATYKSMYKRDWIQFAMMAPVIV